MDRIGYARCSSAVQDPRFQRAVLTAGGCETTRIETASINLREGSEGQKLEAVLDSLRPGRAAAPLDRMRRAGSRRPGPRDAFVGRSSRARIAEMGLALDSRRPPIRPSVRVHGPACTPVGPDRVGTSIGRGPNARKRWAARSAVRRAGPGTAAPTAADRGP